jgi:hypothetical protein
MSDRLPVQRELDADPPADAPPPFGAAPAAQWPAAAADRPSDARDPGGDQPAHPPPDHLRPHDRDGPTGPQLWDGPDRESSTGLELWDGPDRESSAGPEPWDRPDPWDEPEWDFAPPGTATGPAVASGWSRLAADLAWVLVIYLFSRLVQLVIMGWLAPPDDSTKDRLLVWDGGWWIRLATEGYPHGYTYEHGRMVGNGLAFFPLYPTLIRLLDGTGLDAGSSALIIAWVAAAVACVLLFQFGKALSGGNVRVGFALVVLFCTQPMSIVLSMGYSEALFMALVIGALLACRYQQWLLAGPLTCAAGLTRPTGAALALALLVAAVVAVVRRQAGWQALLGAGLGLIGVPSYLIWVGLRVGQPDAWFRVQSSGWGTTTDYGRSSFEFVRTALHQGDGWVQVSIALLLLTAVAAVLVAVVRRTWLPLSVYGVVTLAMVIGQAGYYHSKPRLLLPVLLTLVPAAFAAARARTTTAVFALTVYGLFGMWFGAYMLVVWHYTI